MAVTITDAQLRAVLQLPARPYPDTYVFDGSNYYDLSRREAVQILTASGTASGSAHRFVLNTDFQLTSDCIDWTIPGGVKPDYGTAFTIEYLYSPLGSATASTAVANASAIVAQDLGSSFPYGQISPQGIAYNALAQMGVLFVAAREACHSMVTSEIVNAEKYRRGAVLVDDTKKTADWIDAAERWNSQYKRYLTMIRPAGMVRAFAITKANLETLVFSANGSSFDPKWLINGEYLGPGSGHTYGGVI